MKTILWDVDDVLNDLMKEWFKRWLNEHPSCPATYVDLIENPPDSILHITRNEYLQSLDLFRLSTDYPKMEPIPEVIAWFTENGSRYHNATLTAVPLKGTPVSAAWAFKHFGQWIRSFHFVPSKRSAEMVPEYDRNKKEFLKRNKGIDLLIDDNPDNCTAAHELGIKALLFPRPWNGSQLSTSELLSIASSL